MRLFATDGKTYAEEIRDFGSPKSKMNGMVDVTRADGHVTYDVPRETVKALTNDEATTLTRLIDNGTVRRSMRP